MYSKETFFNELEEIINDPIIIGYPIHREVLHNKWSISITQALAEELTIEEMDRYIQKIINNRREQLNKSDKRNDMKFYIFFDIMSGNLVFNIISYKHALPFKCDYEIVKELEPIIKDFLSFPYHDIFPINEEGNGNTLSDEHTPFILKVYVEKLKKLYSDE